MLTVILFSALSTVPLYAQQTEAVPAPSNHIGALIGGGILFLLLIGYTAIVNMKRVGGCTHCHCEKEKQEACSRRREEEHEHLS